MFGQRLTSKHVWLVSSLIQNVQVLRQALIPKSIYKKQQKQQRVQRLQTTTFEVRRLPKHLNILNFVSTWASQLPRRATEGTISSKARSG